MNAKFYTDVSTGEDILEFSQKGVSLLRNSLSNRGSAFTEEEREKYGLLGLLPAAVGTIDIQVMRAYKEYQQIGSDLGKHVFLRALQDRNEVLFFALMERHITEMMPIIYTPTIGLACQQFSRIYRQPRGLFITYEQRNQIDAILEDAPYQEIAVIVVTDGERILGLGDLGVGGMGIPVGKLSLYTLCGGLHPATTLPIFLDVGTNNAELLADPLYLGARHQRIDGEEYDAFIEKFISAVMRKWPRVLLQWEDFGRQHARTLLERYRNRLCSFNDDIQGTAAVTLSGLLAATRSEGKKLKDQRIVIFGAGTAGIGIAEFLLKEMMDEGLTEQEALEHFFLVDKDGLLHLHTEDVQYFQKKYLLTEERLKAWEAVPGRKFSLEQVVEVVKPTVLIGTSAQGGAFTKSIVTKMSNAVERPIIFPLSNPTSQREADPADLIVWSEGRAIVATGNPFSWIEYQGRSIPISQCNNSYIFPGIGLGVVASKPQCISDQMFAAAAVALSECSPIMQDPYAPLFPPLEDIWSVSQKIAIAVGKEAQVSGGAEVLSLEELERRIHAKMWKPHYPVLRYSHHSV